MKPWALPSDLLPTVLRVVLLPIVERFWWNHGTILCLHWCFGKSLASFQPWRAIWSRKAHIEWFQGSRRRSSESTSPFWPSMDRYTPKSHRKFVSLAPDGHTNRNHLSSHCRTHPKGHFPTSNLYASHFVHACRPRLERSARKWMLSSYPKTLPWLAWLNRVDSTWSCQAAMRTVL